MCKRHMINFQIRILLFRERCSQFWLADNNIRAWPVKGLARLRFLENFPWERIKTEYRSYVESHYALCNHGGVVRKRPGDKRKKGTNSRYAVYRYRERASFLLLLHLRRAKSSNENTTQASALLSAPAPVSPDDYAYNRQDSILLSPRYDTYFFFFRKKHGKTTSIPLGGLCVAISCSLLRNYCVTCGNYYMYMLSIAYNVIYSNSSHFFFFPKRIVIFYQIFTPIAFYAPYRIMFRLC